MLYILHLCKSTPKTFLIYRLNVNHSPMIKQPINVQVEVQSCKINFLPFSGHCYIWSHVNRKDVSKYCSAQSYVCVYIYIYRLIERQIYADFDWTYFHLSYFWRTVSLHRKHYCRWQETKNWKQRVFSLETEVYTAMYTESFNCHSEQ